jgi:hypothetical protein
LDTVVFLVGFLEESEVLRPNAWKPDENNTYVIVMPKLDMAPYMEKAEAWYKEYILNGYTPEWSDEADAELLKYIRAKPKDAKRK